MVQRTLRSPRRRSALIGIVLVAALTLAACTVDGRLDLPDRGDRLTAFPDGGGRSSADGYIPDGGSVSVFDESLPAIAGLDPELRVAVQAATTAAAADGVEMVVTSGWRSPAYQQALLDDATARYGSLAEARKWVSTPELSAHVTGDAVDIGYTDADSWLSQHGTDYGLCQIYTNEMWHFELPIEPGGSCPVQRLDATAG